MAEDKRVIGVFRELKRNPGTPSTRQWLRDLTEWDQHVDE